MKVEIGEFHQEFRLLAKKSVVPGRDSSVNKDTNNIFIPNYY